MSQLENTLDLYKQMDTGSAANVLDLSERKLEKMRQHGDGPKFIRVSPKCVRYRLIDLIEYQESRLRKNTIETGAQS